MNIIYTIGHSNRSIDEFILLLKRYDIQVLADVRSYPGSRWFPWFNKEKLSVSLDKEGIEYIHLSKLGGKNHIKKGAEKVSSLASYEDNMRSDTFLEGIEALTQIAGNKNTAIMCAEADWQKCHRSFISNFLHKQEWKICHISKDGTEEHFIEPKQGNLFKS